MVIPDDEMIDAYISIPTGSPNRTERGQTSPNFQSHQGFTAEEHVTITSSSELEVLVVDIQPMIPITRPLWVYDPLAEPKLTPA